MPTPASGNLDRKRTGCRCAPRLAVLAYMGLHEASYFRQRQGSTSSMLSTSLAKRWVHGTPTAGRIQQLKIDAEKLFLIHAHRFNVSLMQYDWLPAAYLVRLGYDD
ncbi:hypothetical protein BM221_002733 [Beauveria bassiana]|uniref:Uncharacterized protein n=1 Tax=Beauveria bassiana TaxID=176275 RepID=A0A2N6NSP5_BEABA|nr:hypothetical protein BM221_002733 [Beauveria bassiana]